MVCLAGLEPALPLKVLPARLLSNMSAEDIDLLEELVLEIRQVGKRPSYNLMVRVIKQICSIQPFSAAQLATILERNPHRLQEKYLKPMVDAGDLDMLFPNAPKHKKQAYIAKTDGEVE